MKTQFGLLFLVVAAIAVGCSSDEGKLDQTASGGTTGDSDAGATGGTLVIEAGADPAKPDWTNDAGEIADGGGPGVIGDTDGDGSQYFNDLENLMAEGDPCAQVAMWVLETNTGDPPITEGSMVVISDGTVFKYVLGEMCNDKITWMDANCDPVAPVEWCSNCWELVPDITCEYSGAVDTSDMSDLGGGGGLGGATSTGTTTTTTSATPATGTGGTTSVSG